MLNVVERGTGPEVVLLHGLFGDAGNLGGLARPLSSEYRVLSLDLPNHGRSPHSGVMDIPGMAQEVASALKTFSVENPVVLGHSLGGKVAMELSFLMQLEGLVVLDIGPRAYEGQHGQIFSALEAIEQKEVMSRKDASQLLVEAISEPQVVSFLMKGFAGTTDGGTWRFNWRALQACYAELVSSISPGVFDGPALFLRGELSAYIRDDDYPGILAQFPLASIETIPAAGHWLHAEQPELCLRAINCFLEGLD